MVASLATIYKKLKFLTNENLGWGRIHLPEIELQTTAAWLTVDPAIVAAGPGGPGGGMSSTWPWSAPAGPSRPWPASC